MPADSAATTETVKTEPESPSLSPVRAGGGSPICPDRMTPEESIPISKPQKHVNEMLEVHGRTLVEKVVAGDSANAQAHLYRTLVEFTIPKPETRVSLTAGGVIIHVGEVE